MRQLILEICTALVLCLATRAWKFKALFIDRASLSGTDASGDRRCFRILHVGCCGLATFFRNALVIGVTLGLTGYPMHWWSRTAGVPVVEFAYLCLTAYVFATMWYEIREEAAAVGKERSRQCNEVNAAKSLRTTLEKIDGSVSYSRGNSLERFYARWTKLLNAVYDFNNDQDRKGQGADGEVIVRYQAVYDDHMRAMWLLQTVVNAVVVVAAMRVFN